MKKTANDSNWQAIEMLLLQETMKQIGKDGKPDAAINTMLHLMSELIGLNRGRIVLADTDGLLRIHYSYGLTAEQVALGQYYSHEGITGAVYSNSHALMVQDIHSDNIFLGRAVSRTQLPQEKVSFIALPLKSNNHTFGVLACHRLRMSERTLYRDMALLNTLATLCSQLLHWQTINDATTQNLINHNEALKKALQSNTRTYGIIGSSPALLKAIRELEQVSDSNANVLLLGESGTGKELFARALHTASPRVNKPFIKVNCAAIPESLFESELFGHEKGAFTGATSERVGLFQQADGGTIFLDEIGELTLPVQSKILRTLQEGTITRLGGRKEIKIDVRIVTATHKNLAEAVQHGDFRQDLYYRLYVIPIMLPALRERRSDIPELVAFFLNRINQQNRRSVNLTAEAIQALQQYNWPGNIRQLQNMLERLVLLSHGTIVDAMTVEKRLAQQHEENLTIEVEAYSPVKDDKNSKSKKTKVPMTFDTDYEIRPYMQAMSHNLDELNAVLVRCRGNKTQAAAMLGMTPRQFNYRWKILNQAPAS